MSVFLPDNVVIPEESIDQLYFLNGIGHVWPFEIGSSNSQLWTIGGYEIFELQKRLWQIDSRINVYSFWAPRQFLRLTIWISSEAWTLPELKFRNQAIRIPVEWRGSRVRLAGPNYVPDPPLNNALYCRPGNVDQAWNECLIRLPKAGNYFLNIENNTPFRYPVDYTYWGGIWYKKSVNL